MKRLIFAFISAIILSLSAPAATQQQMEQARAAVYRLCLRYMNNGSGYLDDSKFPTSTSELESTIGRHEKEQANLKRLQSIPVPPESEYASWDKGAFDKFWTVTFFDKVPSFDAKSACRGQVAKRVSAIKVTVAEPVKEAPAEVKPEEAQAPAEEQKPEEEATPEEAGKADEALAAAPENVPAADSVLAAATDGPVNAEKQSKDSGNTMSIIVLCVLVLVVVGLVAYALNVMRKNKEQDETPVRRRSQRETREPEPTPVSNVDEEDESAFASYAAPEEPRDSRDAEIATLRAELDRLRRQTGKQEQRYTPGSSRPRQPRVIYLARANADGVFTRADASYNMGNSIFKLVTTDGVSGTYQVIDDPAVFELALMTPTDYLENACTGRNLQLSQGASVIINEAAGTAIFDRGRWRVTRKAQIRYSR